MMAKIRKPNMSTWQGKQNRLSARLECSSGKVTRKDLSEGYLAGANHHNINFKRSHYLLDMAATSNV